MTLSAAALAGALAVIAIAQNDASPATRTVVAVHRGSVTASTALERRQIGAGETAVIAGGRLHGNRGLTADFHPRQTWLAVLAGSVAATPRNPAYPAPFTVPAGHEALFGDGQPRLGPLDPARVILARLMSQRAVADASGDRLSATVRAALARLNGLAAERLRRRDAAGLRALAVADCRVGARPLASLARRFDELSALTRSVEVAYVVRDWRPAGADRATAFYAASIALAPHIAPDLRAEIAIAGTVSYRRLAGSWRFENFGISHASVDTRKLPAAFDQINDLLVPESP